MTELRLDVTTNNWVIVAPERSSRPELFRHGATAPELPDASCPFCVGHEDETPPEICRVPGDNGAWRVRVVANKFPALSSGGTHDEIGNRWGFSSMPGTGSHEVVIESPDHGWDTSGAPTDELVDVLKIYRARHLALSASSSAGMVVIFRNHGPGAGTSLPHPHSQIIATHIVPLVVRQRLEIARRHYARTNHCLYVELLHQELADGRRIVAQNAGFVAFQPFASSSPFETWIMPRTHRASFSEVTDEELASLAPLLRLVLGGIRRALNDPDYNYVIHSAPSGEEDRRSVLWHMQIVPRITTPAGFELGSGIPVNVSAPEATAATLRDVLQEGVVP